MLTVIAINSDGAQLTRSGFESAKQALEYIDANARSTPAFVMFVLCDSSFTNTHITEYDSEGERTHATTIYYKGVIL